MVPWVAELISEHSQSNRAIDGPILCSNSLWVRWAKYSQKDCEFLANR